MLALVQLLVRVVMFVMVLVLALVSVLLLVSVFVSVFVSVSVLLVVFGALAAGDNKVAEVKGVQVDGWAVVKDGGQVATIGQRWLGSVADSAVGQLHGCFLHGFRGCWQRHCC